MAILSNTVLNQFRLSFGWLLVVDFRSSMGCGGFARPTLRQVGVAPVL